MFKNPNNGKSLNFAKNNKGWNNDFYLQAAIEASLVTPPPPKNQDNSSNNKAGSASKSQFHGQNPNNDFNYYNDYNEWNNGSDLQKAIAASLGNSPPPKKQDNSSFVCNECSGKTNVCHGTSSGCTNANLSWKTDDGTIHGLGLAKEIQSRANVNSTRRNKNRGKKNIPGKNTTKSGESKKNTKKNNAEKIRRNKGANAAQKRINAEKKKNKTNMGGSRRKRRKSRRKIAGTYSQLAKNLLKKKRIVDVSPLGHPSLVGKNLGKVSLSRGKESPFVPKKVYSAPSVGLVNWNPRAVPGKTHIGGKRRKSRKRRKTRRRRTTRKGK